MQSFVRTHSEYNHKKPHFYFRLIRSRCLSVLIVTTENAKKNYKTSYKNNENTYLFFYLITLLFFNLDIKLNTF